MNTVVLLLAFAASALAQRVDNHPFFADRPSLDMTFWCNFLQYSHGLTTETGNVFHHAGTTKRCLPGWAFYMRVCNCLPGENARRLRPYCEDVFTLTGGQQISNMVHNKHVEESGGNPLITLDGAYTCFAASAYLQLDWTADNDFGTQTNFMFSVRVSAQGTLQQSANRIVLFTNGGCPWVGQSTPSFQMTYNPYQGSYTLLGNGLSSECDVDGPNAGHRTTQTFTVNDVINIRHENGLITVNIRRNNNILINCQMSFGQNAFLFKSQTLLGAMCPLRIGSLGTHAASVCYGSVRLQRDCEALPSP